MTARRQLTSYPLFALLTDQQLDVWLSAGQEQHCATGETIFQEGTTGAWIYLVQEGRVRVLRQSRDREITLGAIGPGEIFGDYALVPPGKNTATCRASGQTRLLRLPLLPVRRVFQSHPSIWRNLKNWLRLHAVLHLMRDRSFLGFMSAESGLKLLDRLLPAHFSAGQTIQAPGLADDRWYILEQGLVDLMRPGLDESEELGPGDSFGARTLAGQEDESEAVARTDVRCMSLTRMDFDPALSVSRVSLQSYAPRMPGGLTAPAWVAQQEESDCGLAALATIATVRGRTLTVDDLRRQIQPGPSGLTLQQLQAVALANGLPCRAVRVSVDRLSLVALPAIAHLVDGHYVVLHSQGSVGVVLADPASGVVTWSRDLYTSRSSEFLLVFAPPGPGSRGR